jgi:regulator of protease activity HflC (stomatin/prohibitin superfamily)
MGTVVFLVGFVGIAAYVATRILAWSNSHREGFPIGVVIRAVIMFGGLIVLTNLASAIVVIPAGNRGVVFNKFSGVRATPLNEGMNLILPFVEDKILFDVRVQKADVKASAASKDLQDVTTEVVLNFRPKADAVAAIYKNYGSGVEEKVIAPAVQESVKAVVATYTAEEIITKREELKGKVQEQLARMIATADLVLVETYMTNFSFSQGFSQAIESKQIAEQESLKAKRVLDRVRIEADQKVAQARAEAEGLRMQRDAITPELLKLREIEMQRVAIEKWNGKLPDMMVGNTIPFINLDKK